MIDTLVYGIPRAIRSYLYSFNLGGALLFLVIISVGWAVNMGGITPSLDIKEDLWTETCSIDSFYGEFAKIKCPAMAEPYPLKMSKGELISLLEQASPIATPLTCTATVQKYSGNQTMDCRIKK